MENLNTSHSSETKENVLKVQNNKTQQELDLLENAMPYGKVGKAANPGILKHDLDTLENGDTMDQSLANIIGKSCKKLEEKIHKNLKDGAINSWQNLNTNIIKPYNFDEKIINSDPLFKAKVINKYAWSCGIEINKASNINSSFNQILNDMVRGRIHKIIADLSKFVDKNNLSFSEYSGDQKRQEKSPKTPIPKEFNYEDRDFHVYFVQAEKLSQKKKKTPLKGTTKNAYPTSKSTGTLG